jgi:hypothetical protein
MTKATLEAMMRRASRMADKCFEEDGEVVAFWLVENGDGDQTVLVTPMVVPEGMDRNAAKEMMARRLREDFKRNGVVRYVSVMEAWTSECKPPPLARDLPDDKGRVFVTAVQGAPFQVLGRRHEGVLYAGSMFRVKADEAALGMAEGLNSSFKAHFGGKGLEIITGPEAADLIASLGAPKDNPKREEGVHLEASDGERTLQALRKIVRPAGRPPYIEALMEIWTPDAAGGRFSNMLDDIPVMQ